MMRTPAELLHHTGDLLTRLRESSPLVQCLTNSVTTNFVANAVLAVGGSPAMVDIPVEAGVLARAASAVLINLGTPPAEQREAMLEAAVAANDVATPWVLDPVGVGSLPIRTALAERLLELRPSLIRGNASEVWALASSGAGGRGVDSAHAVDDARDAAMMLARATGGVVAVSGPIDLITDGRDVIRIANGRPLLTRITGAGCALGAVCAAFLSLTEDRFAATVAACTAYGVAAELAALTTDRPGSFAVALLDALSVVDAECIANRGRVL